LFWGVTSLLTPVLPAFVFLALAGGRAASAGDAYDEAILFGTLDHADHQETWLSEFGPAGILAPPRLDNFPGFAGVAVWELLVTSPVGESHHVGIHLRRKWGETDEVIDFEVDPKNNVGRFTVVNPRLFSEIRFEFLQRSGSTGLHPFFRAFDRRRLQSEPAPLTIQTSGATLESPYASEALVRGSHRDEWQALDSGKPPVVPVTAFSVIRVYDKQGKLESVDGQVQFRQGRPSDSWLSDPPHKTLGRRSFAGPFFKLRARNVPPLFRGARSIEIVRSHSQGRAR
jgi:hypothetical protein